MEKFAVDLDKVLDDFELDEDRASELISGKESHITGYNKFYRPSNSAYPEPNLESRLTHNESGHLPHLDANLTATLHIFQPNYTIPVDVSTELLDLSEADFAASLKSTTLTELPPRLASDNFNSSIQTPSLLSPQVLSDHNEVNKELLSGDTLSEEFKTSLKQDSVEPVLQNNDINLLLLGGDMSSGELKNTLKQENLETPPKLVNGVESSVNRTKFGFAEDMNELQTILESSATVEKINSDNLRTSADLEDAAVQLALLNKIYDVSVPKEDAADNCVAQENLSAETEEKICDDNLIKTDQEKKEVITESTLLSLQDEKENNEKTEQISDLTVQNVIGFSDEIEVTEEDVHNYLSDLESDFKADQPLSGEEFFTPMLEEPETVTDQTITENSAQNEALLVSENVLIDPKPNVVEDDVEVSSEDNALSEESSSGYITPCNSIPNTCDEEISKQCPDPEKTIENDIPENEAVPVTQVSDTNCTDDSQNDEAVSSRESETETASDMSEVNTHLKLQRPTTLYLSKRIEVVPSVSPDAVQEDNFQTEGSEMYSPNGSDSPDVDQQMYLSDEERQLGKVAPVWVPDYEAPNCMQCDAKFTVLRRRHHCRACGKVLCSQCCGLKAKLPYMDDKEARVCQNCLQIINKVQVVERGALSPSARPVPTRFPNPNNPSEYCSTVPPLEQVDLNAPPPTVLVPVGVLKREGRPRGEPKQVMFSDGIRPGGDLTELDGSCDTRLPNRRQGRIQKRVETSAGLSSPGKHPRSFVSSPIVPRLRSSSTNAQHFVAEYPFDGPYDESVMAQIRDESANPVVFVVNKNLCVLTKIVNLDCCMNQTCWCFCTKGLSGVGQDELVVILECLPDETIPPIDIFFFFSRIYEEAGKGGTVSNLGHTIFTHPFLGSKDHGGFLYVRTTFQCLHKLPVPPSPFLVAILLQKWEIPWAKVFPIRLMLRLGAEFHYYPTPLVSVRFRQPVFYEIGHTIMNLLADFRNYQYMLPAVSGMVIHMEDKKTYINFPRNRYDETMKALNNSIDHVLALGGNFSTEADSHLLCIQNEEGSYQTQAINIKDRPRKVTGASFIVFNGALKTSSGLTAKSSIVEDGLMVQIPSDTMQILRQTLRDMKDYTIPCGPIGVEQPDEVVKIVWVSDDANINIGVKSPIDNMAMDGITSIRIHCGTDYMGDNYLIRWTEVFLIHSEESINSRRSDPVDISKTSDILAQSCCIALTPHLGHLYEVGYFKIGLRVTLDAENVGYDIGAGGERLPPTYMNDLDSELIPCIHRVASPTQEGPVVLELIFHILEQ